MSFRSILFTPATKLDRLSKAFSASPDWVAIDLEDGVPISEKDHSRQVLEDFSARNFDGHSHQLGIRINALSTPAGVKDMASMLDWPLWPDLLILPKVEAPIQIHQITELAASRGRVPTLVITVETALGIENAHDILRAAPAGSAVGYGSADHVAETGGDMGAASLAWARGRIVNAAAAVGLPALDGVWLQYNDTEGLLNETRLIKSMGFSGKIAIHPDQIEPIHSVLSPTEAEIETALAMIAAFDEAGGRAFSFHGKMVDAPVLERARRITKTQQRSTE